ncbi:MAG TPA: potassium-transporting ATPase subunit KdpC [Bdellovibrionota bacterium]|nr:potassium-transporting ATPase subunit KdpC [Bdellovibrionota bacterium]
MLKLFVRSTIMTLVLAVILCGAYPLLVTGVGRLLFPNASTGSLVKAEDGRIVGSSLIGQPFAKPEYFHPRPSAAGSGYDGASSSGTNLGPTSQKLADQVKAAVEAVLKENPTLKKGAIPPDMVTSSASGLDPHISPENALAQADRVATARGVSADQVRDLIKERVEGPQWRLFGEPAVNVLLLNLDLDRKLAKAK